jgi:hypothetical protein
LGSLLGTTTAQGLLARYLNASIFALITPVVDAECGFLLAGMDGIVSAGASLRFSPLGGADAAADADAEDEDDVRAL